MFKHNVLFIVHICAIILQNWFKKYMVNNISTMDQDIQEYTENGEEWNWITPLPPISSLFAFTAAIYFWVGQAAAARTYNVKKM